MVDHTNLQKRLTIHRVQEVFERSPDMLIVGEQLLSRQECDIIINTHIGLPYTEVDYDMDGVPGKIATKDTSVMETQSYKYVERDGKEFTVLTEGTPEFNRCIELVMDFLPKNEDYQGINYAQIIRYPEESCFQFHKDTADGNDTATAIFLLNEEYEGGRLNVEGHTFQPRRGTMITFNNSTERWHGVEPVYKGERWVFAIWFGRYEEVFEEDNDDESTSEVQSVSDTTGH